MAYIPLHQIPVTPSDVRLIATESSASKGRRATVCDMKASREKFCREKFFFFSQLKSSPSRPPHKKRKRSFPIHAPHPAILQPEMPTASATTRSRPASVAGATTALVLLTALNFVNYIDRYILPAVQEQVKHEFHLSDEHTLGTTFTFWFMIAYMATLANHWPGSVTGSPR